MGNKLIKSLAKSDKFEIIDFNEKTKKGSKYEGTVGIIRKYEEIIKSLKKEFNP